MEELVKTLPFIVGAAISPVLLVTTLLVVSSQDRPISKALAYLLGGTITITAISLVVFYTNFLKSLPHGNKNVFPHIIIGLILIILAVNIYKRGPTKPSTQAKSNKQQGLLRYIFLGIILMLTNFTTVAMVFAVALEIHTGDVTGVMKIAYLIATIISSLLSVLIPLFILFVAGKHSDNILKSLSNFMKQYAFVVTSIFFALLGIYSLAKPFIG